MPAGVDWVEAGTPLIKSEGLDAVRELKRLFPDKVIVADMKIMDAGRTEVEVAAKAGAQIVDVLGTATDATIAECVQAGKNYGAKIAVDLIAVADPAVADRLMAYKEKLADKVEQAAARLAGSVPWVSSSKRRCRRTARASTARSAPADGSITEPAAADGTYFWGVWSSDTRGTKAYRVSFPVTADGFHLVVGGAWHTDLGGERV